MSQEVKDLFDEWEKDGTTEKDWRAWLHSDVGKKFKDTNFKDFIKKAYVDNVPTPPAKAKGYSQSLHERKLKEAQEAAAKATQESVIQTAEETAQAAEEIASKSGRILQTSRF